jgi:hypothetical protein
MVDVEEYPILDDIELPPEDAVGARPKKSNPDSIKNKKGVSLETDVDGMRFDKISDDLRSLFSTPSLMKGESPDLYAELYRWVEEVVQPKNVWDQMRVTDLTNHFWEQQRYRRSIGPVINSKRRPALKKILHEAIGLNDVDSETAVDNFFGIARLEEREITDYATQVRIPKTRAGVVDLMEKHGFVETDIEGVAIETSVDTLADLESLAIKHEIRREAIVRKLERGRKKRNKKLMKPDPRLNGKVRALAQDVPEEPSLSPTEPPP